MHELEPCSFCGSDECTVKLDRVGRRERFKIMSSCRYAYSSLNYESAKLPSKSSLCTNIPVICPFNLQLVQQYTLHLEVQRDHAHDGESSG